MSDLLTPGSAGQPCVGPRGHAVPDDMPDGRMVYRRTSSDGYHLKALTARPGEPCIGAVPVEIDFFGYPVRDSYVLAIPQAATPIAFHAAAISLVHGVGPDDPSGAHITVQANPDSSEHYTYELDGLRPAQAAELIARWTDAWERIKVGQPVKVTAANAKEYAGRIRRAHRACEQTCKILNPSQKHFLDQHADLIGYTSKSGFEEHLKTLRKFGYPWESLRR